MNSMGTSSSGAVRNDARFIGDVVGSYVLASRAQHAAGLKVFACRARSVTTREVVLMAPVIGQVGEAVSLAFQDLGIVRGVVARQLDGGFAVEIRCTDAERATLSGRIQWLKRKVARAVDDRREHRRVLPREPRATLMLESGPVECLIIDMSRSGVAVSADVVVPLGSAVSLGAVHGRVVRYIEAGFAVQFDELQAIDQLEVLLKAKPDTLQ